MLVRLLQQHLLLLVVTGFWDLSKCIEKVIKLSLFHLDSVVMAVLMPYGEGSLLITPWLKVIGIPDDVKCCHMGGIIAGHLAKISACPRRWVGQFGHWDHRILTSLHLIQTSYNYSGHSVFLSVFLSSIKG